MTAVGGDPAYYGINHILKPGPIATSGMFAKGQLPELSPIDEFLKNATAINVLAGNAKEVTPMIASLTVLGYVSAVESYFRTLTRRLIVTDRAIRKTFEGRSLTYAAALYHHPEMLPDALLEETVFSDGSQVKALFKQLAQTERVEQGIEAALKGYEKICTIRHCCVHRFGRLGVRNAVVLGLDEHKLILEHAFSPTISDLENIALAAHNLVLEFNRTVFKAILDRLANPKPGEGADWTWNMNSDRKLFTAYYDLFAIQAGDQKSPALRDVYRSYRDKRRPGAKGLENLSRRTPR